MSESEELDEEDVLDNEDAAASEGQSDMEVEESEVSSLKPCFDYFRGSKFAR